MKILAQPRNTVVNIVLLGDFVLVELCFDELRPSKFAAELLRTADLLLQQDKMVLEPFVHYFLGLLHDSTSFQSFLGTSEFHSWLW